MENKWTWRSKADGCETCKAEGFTVDDSGRRIKCADCDGSGENAETLMRSLAGDFER